MSWDKQVDAVRMLGFTNHVCLALSTTPAPRHADDDGLVIAALSRLPDRGTCACSG